MPKRTEPLLIAGLLAVGVLALAGCGDKDSAKGRPPPKGLLFFSGAGLRDAVDELTETFSRENGVEIAVDYAGSQVLLTKLKLVRQGDVYIPGDKRYVDMAAAEGLVASRRSVCYFVPTILVQKGNPKRIAGLADLFKGGVRVGLGDVRACAIGRVAKEVLEKNGIAWSEVEKALVFQSTTVNELGMQIQAGSLDAVILWDAIAKQYAEYGDEVAIPVEQNVISTVDIGVLEFSTNKALAKDFVAFAASDRGQAVFRKHGYSIDRPR